jgi:hypothetical protein
MEKKKLIPAYKNNADVTKDYINKTTREDSPLEIKRMLYNYKNKPDTEQVVCDVIDKIIFNETLLNKVVIVSDLSYRSCAICIKSNRVTVSSSGGYSNINPKYTYTELLKYFENKAEKIFIYLEDNKISTSFASSFIFYDYLNPISQAIESVQNIFDDKVNQTNNSITDKELAISMLKGELSAINDKINECLDVSIIDNCDEKKYFYNTMFNQLCKEKENIQNELNKIKN